MRTWNAALAAVLLSAFVVTNGAIDGDSAYGRSLKQFGFGGATSSSQLFTNVLLAHNV